MSAPSYDSSGIASSASAPTSLSYSHTVTGANVGLFVGIGYGADPGSSTTATYNSVGLTSKGHTTTATFYFTDIYADVGVATGANTLACTLTGAPNTYNGALIGVSVANMAQSSSFGTVASGSAGSGQPSISLSTTVDDFCFLVAYGDDIAAPSAGSGLTLRQEVHNMGGNYGACVATKVATGASETMNVTGFKGTTWLAQAIGFHALPTITGTGSLLAAVSSVAGSGSVSGGGGGGGTSHETKIVLDPIPIYFRR